MAPRNDWRWVRARAGRIFSDVRGRCKFGCILKFSLRATVEHVAASHVSMVLQPAVVAKMILAAAEKVAKESLELTAK